VSDLFALLGGVLAGLLLAGGWLWQSRRALAEARHAAAHDPLTGLPNRAALMLHLQRALRRGLPVGVVLLDLDRLKTVNDSLGHAAGDALLQVVAGRLADLPQPVVLAARLSGDEFVLVVHGDPGQTLAAAQAARQAIGGAAVPLGSHRMQVTASAGIATAAPGLSHRQLLHHADLAMYQAKTTGDAVAAHTPDPAPGPVAPRPLRRSRDRRPPADPAG